MSSGREDTRRSRRCRNVLKAVLNSLLELEDPLLAKWAEEVLGALDCLVNVGLGVVVAQVVGEMETVTARDWVSAAR
jgi:hypothetical protein